jgi:dGTPase
LNWQKLHSTKRLGAEYKYDSTEADLRHEYLRDYDRVIFSSPFRRLQNKTQVFPLPGHIQVHNRLTHSLEVASVGRSLGQKVGEVICQQYPDETRSFYEFYHYQLQTVVATACLAHDLGNPPFGHSGEEAIRTYFENISGKAKEQFEVLLSPNQQADFLFFEGNANTFRLLTHEWLGLHRMCYTTLATVVKYPCSSISGFKKGDLATKKSGYFDSDIAKFELIANEFELPLLHHGGYARHPFVYLTEAADDICYRIIDLEDAWRLGILNINQLESLLLALFDSPAASRVQEGLGKLSQENQRMAYLRAMVINHLTSLCVQVFASNEAQILGGSMGQSLLDLLPSPCQEALGQIDAVSIQKIYNHRSVVETELAGYHVIGGILEEFVQAISRPSHNKSEKILNLLPEQFKQGQSHYHNLLAVLDYISGMTDLYALDLYRKLKGINI